MLSKEKWEKIKAKGKEKYIFVTILTFIVPFIVFTIFFWRSAQKILPVYIVSALVLGILGALVATCSWNSAEKKYGSNK